jgi:hypothetical protein
VPRTPAKQPGQRGETEIEQPLSAGTGTKLLQADDGERKKTKNEPQKQSRIQNRRAHGPERSRGSAVNDQPNKAEGYHPV